MQRPVLMLAPLAGIFVGAMLLLPTREGWGGDESEYLNLADNLLHGFYREGTTDGPLDMCFPGWRTPDLWYGPGFPAFLAPFVALGLPLEIIRLLGPGLLFLSMLLFHRLLLHRLKPRAALAGAAAFGLFIPFYRYLPHLHSEFLALAFAVAAMLAMSALVRSGSRLALAAAAAALAGLALTRVAYGLVLTLLVAFWLLWWLVRRTVAARRLAYAHALALALCIPWLVYTYTVTDRPFLWGTSGSLSVYWMSSPHPDDRGDWHCASDVATEGWLAPHRPFFEAHEDEPPLEQNRALERRALANIRGDPGKYALNLAANAARMFVNAPYSRRQLDLRTIAVFVVPGVLLLAMLIVAAFRVAHARRPVPPEAIAFAVFATSAFVIHLPISAYTRMLIPITPALFWLVVYGLASEAPASSRPLAVRSPRGGTKPL